MKFLLKVMFAPVVAVLAILVSVCAFALQITAGILGIAGSILGTLGLLVLIFDGAKNGLIVLCIAFLVSPYGLPMVAAWLLGQLQNLRYLIQDAVYG